MLEKETESFIKNPGEKLTLEVDGELVKVFYFGRKSGGIIVLGIDAPKNISVIRDNIKKRRIKMNSGEEILLKAYYIEQVSRDIHKVRLKFSEDAPENKGQVMLVDSSTIKRLNIQKPVE